MSPQDIMHCNYGIDKKDVPNIISLLTKRGEAMLTLEFNSFSGLPQNWPSLGQLRYKDVTALVIIDVFITPLLSLQTTTNYNRVGVQDTCGSPSLYFHLSWHVPAWTRIATRQTLLLGTMKPEHNSSEVGY